MKDLATKSAKAARGELDDKLTKSEIKEKIKDLDDALKRLEINISNLQKNKKSGVVSDREERIKNIRNSIATLEKKKKKLEKDLEEKGS